MPGFEASTSPSLIVLFELPPPPRPVQKLHVKFSTEAHFLMTDSLCDHHWRFQQSHVIAFGANAGFFLIRWIGVQFVVFSSDHG